MLSLVIRLKTLITSKVLIRRAIPSLYRKAKLLKKKMAYQQPHSKETIATIINYANTSVNCLHFIILYYSVQRNVLVKS